MFDEKDLIVKDDRIYYENDGRVLAKIDFEDIGEKRILGIPLFMRVWEVKV